MKHIILFFAITFSSLILLSCSELEENISPAPEITTHGSEVYTPSSENYHGNLVLESPNKLKDCQQCHDADFSGGITKIGCNTSNCHPTIGVHKDGIIDQTSENFHSKYLKNTGSLMANCSQCHGADFSGGLASPTCSNCHSSIAVHKTGIIDPVSENFHPKYLKNTGSSMENCSQCHGVDFSGGLVSPTCSNCHSSIGVHKVGLLDPASENFHPKYLKNTSTSMANCSQCHGADFSGGLTSPTCSNCHSGIGVHKEGLLDPGSSNFHGKFIAAKNWNLNECTPCHNTDYSGGLVSPTCLNCHSGNNGPEACNTCHGDFADPSKIAPPQALNGSLQTTYAGVGAHTAHLYNNNLGSEILCSTCHNIPQSLYADGHLGDDRKAELNFSGLSKLGGVNPNYSFASNNCSDTYCHGNFTFYKDSSAYVFVYTAATMVGNNPEVKWNQVDGTQAQCGSCHGLPPVGHMVYALTDCVGCHYGVVNAQGEIIDPSKHINGVKNVFGN